MRWEAYDESDLFNVPHIWLLYEDYTTIQAYVFCGLFIGKWNGMEYRPNTGSIHPV